MKSFEKLKLKWPYLAIIIISVLVMIPQWHARAAFVGLDSIFHMNRFYDTMMQIKTGDYSYFQSFFGFGQSGRVVNAVYGPLFAYFNGFVLLLAKNWVNYQVISSIILFIICGGLMYHLGIKNYVKPIWALVMAISYMFSTPVLYWINGQQFTAWGAAFVPLLMLAGTNMMREHRVHWIKLALSMTLVLQIHNVTSAICAMALIPFFITGLITSDHRKQMIIDLIKAIGLTLLLSANVWGGMLELFSSNHLVPVMPDLTLASDALFFLHGATKLALSALVFFAIAALYLIVRWKHLSINTKVIALTGLFFLWIPSHYFPWALLSKLVPAVDSVIQNPIRFLVIPYVLLYLTLGILLSDDTIKWSRIVASVIITLLMLFVVAKDVRHVQAKVHQFNGHRVVISTRLSVIQTTDPDKLRRALRSDDLRSFLKLDTKSTPDYMPANQKISANEYSKFRPYSKYRKQIIKPNLNEHRKVNDGIMIVKWTNNTAKTISKRLPVVKYAHSIVTLNGKTIQNVKTSSIGAIIVNSKPGVNQLTIRYQSATWFRGLVLISVMGWLVLIGYGVWLFIRKR